MTDNPKVDAILEAFDALNREEKEHLFEMLSDEITMHLDKLGWMIGPTPKIAAERVRCGGLMPRWFLVQPRKNCPAWCQNGLPDDDPPPKPTTRLVT